MLQHTICLTCLQSLCVQAGWLSHAIELLRRCGAVWGLLDQRTYVTAISRLLKQRRRRGLPAAQHAYQLWRELSDGASSFHRRCICASRCAANIGNACSTLQAWLGVHPVTAPSVSAPSSCMATSTSMHFDTRAYGHLNVCAGVAACVAVGRLGEAESLLAWAREAGVRAGHGAYNRLLTYHTQRWDMAAALQCLKTMRARGYEPDLVSWNTMIWGYARTGETVRARAMLDKARRTGFEPDAWAWSALLHVSRDGLRLGRQCLPRWHGSGHILTYTRAHTWWRRAAGPLTCLGLLLLRFDIFSDPYCC